MTKLSAMDKTYVCAECGKEFHLGTFNSSTKNYIYKKHKKGGQLLMFCSNKCYAKDKERRGK